MAGHLKTFQSIATLPKRATRSWLAANPTWFEQPISWSAIEADPVAVEMERGRGKGKTFMGTVFRVPPDTAAAVLDLLGRDGVGGGTAVDPGSESERPSGTPRTRATPSSRVGSPYRVASAPDRAVPEPFEVDPDKIDRANRSHVETQNALAEWLRTSGHEPRSPGPGDPEFDLAWEASGTLYVVEVKSLTPENEERQLRLGLGQVLRYRDLLGGRATPVVAVLAVERRPSDKGWHRLCRDLGVTLVWPGAFEQLAPRTQR